MNLIQFFTRPRPARSSSSPLDQKSEPFSPASPGRRSGKGQSLVETAVALPVFLLLLLGVFEVGWALRAYLVLANVNREATRFAARGVYLDLKQKTDWTQVGYDKVVSHTYNALSAQLNPLSLNAASGNSSVIVTYYNVEPQAFVCPGDEDCSDYNCSLFEYDKNDLDKGAEYNIVEYPLLRTQGPVSTDPRLPEWYKPANRVLSLVNTTPITGYYYYEGPETDVAMLSRINTKEKVAELRSENNVQNCELLKKRLPPTSNNVIIIENVYYLPQLVGLPFISVFIPDPIPLYTHTAMRMVTNVRALDEPEEEASNCELLPFAIPESRVSGHTQGQQFIIPYDTGTLPGAFGWVDWDSDTNSSAGDQLDNLQHPGNAGLYYDEPPGGTDDHAIDMFLDWLEVNPGGTLSSQIRNQIDGYINSNQVFYFPVFRDVCTTDCASYYEGTGTNGRYRVMTYVALKLKGSSSWLTGNNSTVDKCGIGVNKCLKFEFSHFDPGRCPGNEE